MKTHKWLLVLIVAGVLMAQAGFAAGPGPAPVTIENILAGTGANGGWTSLWDSGAGWVDVLSVVFVGAAGLGLGIMGLRFVIGVIASGLHRRE